ncbi:MAG: SpoIID/LytB domain-containing protein [Paludibacter sp.]|nr:SpoIID/LytB domain-containing protein [Paludibacter sp.]
MKKIKKEPIIRVGILTAPQITFKLNGSFKGPNNKLYDGRKLVAFLKGKIFFDGNYLDELSFEPISEKCSIDVKDVVIGINFHWERKEKQRFKGALEFIIEGRELTAINHITVEDYLTSVISSEMSATASEELLKAHAVISRSWLLNPILNQPAKITRTGRDPSLPNRIIKWYERDAHTNFDVCADDHCQRYQGISRITNNRAEIAVKSTRGEVLTSGNKICNARFSKSCGGISESFENCWEPKHHAYLTKVVDNPTFPEGFEQDLTIEANAEKWIRESPEAFCNTTDKQILGQVLNNYDQETTDFYRWKVQYTQDEISELLARKAKIDFGQIIDLIPVKRGDSGRIIELKIVGTKQTVIVGKELEIRKWLSESHLYSSAFVLDKAEIIDGIPQHFTLTGAGWGHGVGLCQIGAAVMGEKGYTYDEILMHYFKGADMKRIYS